MTTPLTVKRIPGPGRTVNCQVTDDHPLPIIGHQVDVTDHAGRRALGMVVSIETRDRMALGDRGLQRRVNHVIGVRLGG
jgi:hypothetical protein